MFQMALLSKRSTMMLVYSITFISICIVIFAFLLDRLYDHDSDLFNFGPSESFIFVGIKIDTAFKYTILVVFMFFLELLDLLQEEYIEPYIHMITNANDASNREDLRPYTWMNLYSLNHFSLASEGLRNILRILLITTQIPLAVLVWLLKEIARIYFVTQITNNWFTMNEREVEVNKKLIGRRRKRKLVI